MVFKQKDEVNANTCCEKEMRAWEELLETLQQKIGADSVAEWLRPMKVLHFDAANLHLEATPFQQAWFEEHVRPLIKGAFFNNNGRPIRIHWEGSANTKKNQASASSFKISPSPLDREFLLSHFLPSLQDALVFQMANSLAQGEDPGLNPIFISGLKGSGKSHLLQGITHALTKIGRKVFYVDVQTFTDHVVQAMRFGHMQEFRRIYREIDILLVDNVQLLARRTATQEEFFHTFNALHTLGKQIVLTANVPPSQLEEIEQRLISRFEWGILLSLEAPDRSKLLQILKIKAKSLDLHLTAPMFEFLLEQFANPIEPLHVLAIRAKQEITLASMQFALQDLLEREKASKLTTEKILAQTAKQFGISVEELTGKSQMREMVQPRQVAMYLCRNLLEMPFQAIGRLFNRDHSTVMSSVKQIAEAVAAKTQLAESVLFIEKALRRKVF